MVNFYPDFINCTADTVYNRSYNRTATLSQVAGRPTHHLSIMMMMMMMMMMIVITTTMMMMTTTTTTTMMMTI